MGIGSWFFIIFSILFVAGMLVAGQLASRYERKMKQSEKDLKSQKT